MEAFGMLLTLRIGLNVAYKRKGKSRKIFIRPVGLAAASNQRDKC